MNILFERACIEDVAKIIEVQNKCFKDDYLLYGECPAYNETKESIAGQIEKNIVYKIIIDAKIIGDIIICRHVNNKYYLRVLAVSHKWQNFGIGTKAIEFIEKDNPNVLEWNLVTPLCSVRNNHFYRSRGYKKTGEIVRSEHLTLCKYIKIMLLNVR